jgi:hypothetical protein
MFWYVPTSIKGILRGAHSKYPSMVTIVDLMGTRIPSPLQYAQVKLGPNGSCLD